jgi:hypothetical protein
LAGHVPIPIGIPPRTTLLHIRRHQTFWACWIGIKDMQAPYSDWIGRYLCLYDDGRMESITINDDYTEEVLLVKE